MTDVKEITDTGWKVPDATTIKLYRLSSNRTYRVQQLPFGRATITVNLEKQLLDGYMTEPAFKRIQEATGGAFVPEGQTINPAAVAAIAAREPGIEAPAQATRADVVTVAKRRGRKPKGEGGEVA